MGYLARYTRTWENREKKNNTYTYMQEPHDLTALQARLGVSFVNSNILLQALTHRSYLNENPDFEQGHNERLEFLGDAVLELIVTDHLYRTYKLPEGEMT